MLGGLAAAWPSTGMNSWDRYYRSQNQRAAGVLPEMWLFRWHAGVRGDGGSPGGGVYVAGVLGEEPAVAFDVGDAILQFPVDSFLEFFPDCGAVAF